MAKTNPSTVLLKGSPIIKEAPLEALDACGNGAITPGMLCEMFGTDVRPHATATGLARPIIVALEGLALDPNSATMAGIDTDYDEDAQAVRLAYAKPGDEYYMLVAPLAAAILINAALESHGDGYLAGGTTNPVARALEAKDNSAGTTPMRIKVEVM